MDCGCESTHQGPPSSDMGEAQRKPPRQFPHLPLKGKQQVVEWRTKKRAKWKEQMGHHILTGLKEVDRSRM